MGLKAEEVEGVCANRSGLELWDVQIALHSSWK